MLFLYSDELIFTKIFEHFYDPFAIKSARLQNTEKYEKAAKNSSSVIVVNFPHLNESNLL
jgi:hypothetical protein